MRAITAPELVKLRSDGQWSRLYVAGLEAPPVVFAAQINQAFSTAASKDQVLQVEFDNVTTGAYGDVIPGMTIWIGSAAGLHDIGMARARKAFTATIAYLGMESELALANNQYITVVDEFGLWPKHTYISGGITYMDGDVVYSDEHENFAPVPVMGSDAVLDVAAYPATLALDGSGSWVPGGTISAYLWTKTAGTLDSSTSATPTLTVSSYPTNGLIRVALRVTASNGEQSTGYRYVRVYDSTHRPASAQVAAVEGDFEAGGWTCEIGMYDDVSSVRDRSPVIIFARDYYAGVLGSIGQQAGRENIVCAGWVDGETIEWDAEAGMVRFTVKGAQFWLDKMPGFPPKLSEQIFATGSWSMIPSLTVDRALWHLLYWHSTAMMVMDVFLTGDTLYTDEFELPTQSLWAQMKEVAKRILAVPGCDPYNRLIVEVEPQCVPEVDRTWTEVMTITTNDWAEKIGITRRLVGELAMLDLSGWAVTTPNMPARPYYSLSVGHVFARFGGIETMDNLIVESQSQSNDLAGLVMGKRNNPWPNFQIVFGQNNRMFTLFPRQYANLTMQTTDNIRGKEFDGRIIPRHVSLQWEAEGGVITPLVTFEAESFSMNAVDGEAPAINPIPPSPPPPPAPPPTPGPPPVNTDGPHEVLLVTNTHGFLYTLNFQDGVDAQWYGMNGGLTATQYADGVTDYTPIRKVVKTPSGMFYALIYDSADAYAATNRRGGTHIFRCAGLGGSWSPYLYIGDVNGVVPGTPASNRIISLDLNPNSDELLIIGGYKGDMRIMTGTDTAINEIANTPNLDSEIRMGAAVYNLGKYLVFHAEDNALDSRAWSRLSGAGIIEVNTSNDFGTLSGSGDIDHYALNLGGVILYWWHGKTLVHISNNDPTLITSWLEPTGFEIRGDETKQNYIAATPDGGSLMGGGPGTIGQRSSDGGYSWGNIGTAGGMSVGYKVWGNGGDASQWVAATAQKVMLTLDGGDNWLDRSGNLSYLAPFCVPTHVFVIG